MNQELFLYTLHLADNALILGHRNSEWTGHGPNLEQDIAISNIALDLIGQSRNLYQYAASLFNKNNDALSSLINSPAFQQVSSDIDEDDLAYLRDVNEFRNCLLVEQLNCDWARTITRQFLFSAYQEQLYRGMQKSSDLQLAAIAEKSLKEVLYHVRWSGEWIIRLGDGTDESRQRLINAIENLWAFTGELFHPSDYENEIASAGIAPLVTEMKQAWMEKISNTFKTATLELPSNTWMQQGGKNGVHTEHLGFLLAEMQYLQRAYPNSEW